MKTIRRNAIYVFFTIALTVPGILFFYKTEERFTYFRLEEYLKGHHITEDISFTYAKGTEIRLNSTEDPALYVACLPDVESVDSYRVGFSHFKTLVIGGDTFRSGDYIGAYAKSTKEKYQSMQIYAPGGELLYDGWIEFFFLDRTPTIYISTSENAIDIVNETENGIVKPHIEAWVRVIDGDGKQDLLSEAEIFRHGNSTFDNYEPKSYNLTLKSPGSPLGMTSGKKWVLKANSMDNTQIIRNEMAFKTSKMLQLEPYPESRYINLYNNGIYCGMYLLSQRINGLEMGNLDSNEYLLEMDYRYKDEPQYFETENKGIVVHYPEGISQEDMYYISQRYYEAEKAISNGMGYEDYIDVDSFAKMYIIQDFFVQADVDFSSLYFTYRNDGKFYAGPVWDFDLSCGMTSSLPYHEELALKARLFDGAEKQCAFLGKLSRVPEFQERVSEIYRNEFQREMTEYIDAGWEGDIANISDSLEVNRKVNGIKFKDRETLDSTDCLKDWIDKRNKYLLSYYGNKMDYVEVTFHFAWGVMSAAIKRNEAIGFLPDDCHPGNDDVFWGEITGFVDASGNEVDDSMIIYDNMDLYAVYTEDSYAWGEYQLP